MELVKKALTATTMVALGAMFSACPISASTAAPATQLSFENASATVAPGSCGTYALYVHRLTSTGAEAYETTANTVQISALGTTFYSDWQCTQQVTGGVIPASESGVNFYFKPTYSGKLTVTATSSGLTAATQAETVTGSVVAPSPSPTPTVTATATPTPTPTPTSGGATELEFENAVWTVAPGSCGADALYVHRLTASGAEYYGSSAATVQISAPGTTFYSDWECTQAVTSGVIPASESGVNFYFKPTYSGSLPVTATSVGLSTATQEEIVTGTVASPSPTATPSPSPSPTVTTSSGTCSTVGPISGLPYCAYEASSTWNQPLPTNPAINPNSQAMMNTTFANWSGTFYVNPPGSFPYFFTSSSSPNVVIDLTAGWGSSNLQGATVPMPTNAVPATNSDAHLTVLNASNGNEYDYFGFPQSEKIVANETIDVTWGDIINYKTGSGWGGAGTAAGAGQLAGLVTIDEFQSGVIHHALAMAPGCNNGAGSVYPATAVASFTCPSSSGPGIPHGSRIWSDLIPTQVAALKLDKLSTMLLNALYTYGGFVTDTNGWRALDIRNLMEGPTNSTATAWWSANGGNSPGIDSEPASFFTTHFHVLQVCVTEGGC